MLVLKRMTTKKLMIYFSIIALMIGAAVFVLYKNGMIFSQGQPSVDNLAQPGEFTDVEATLPGIKEADLKQSVFDVTIFGSEKFKALEKNVLIPRDEAGAGKADPFKPN